MEKSSILTRVFEIIHDSNLTETAFMTDIGFKQPSWSKICKGERDVSDGLKFKICMKYNISPMWIEYGKGCKYFVMKDEYDFSVRNCKNANHEIDRLEQELATFKKADVV